MKMIFGLVAALICSLFVALPHAEAANYQELKRFDIEMRGDCPAGWRLTAVHDDVQEYVSESDDSLLILPDEPGFCQSQRLPYVVHELYSTMMKEEPIIKRASVWSRFIEEVKLSNDEAEQAKQALKWLGRAYVLCS